LGLKGFFRAAARVFGVLRKPDRKLRWTSIKICVLGLLGIGAVGFLIRLLASAFQA